MFFLMVEMFWCFYTCNVKDPYQMERQYYNVLSNDDDENNPIQRVTFLLCCRPVVQCICEHGMHSQKKNIQSNHKQRKTGQCKWEQPKSNRTGGCNAGPGQKQTSSRNTYWEFCTYGRQIWCTSELKQTSWFLFLQLGIRIQWDSNPAIQSTTIQYKERERRVLKVYLKSILHM